MSKENYTFDDLDDILAEFSSKNENFYAPVVEESFSPAAEIKPIEEKKIEAKPVEKKPAPAMPERKAVERPSFPEKAEAPKAEKKAKSRKAAGSSFEEFEALFSSESIKQEAAAKRAAMNKKSSAKQEFTIDAPAAPRKAAPQPVKEKPVKAPAMAEAKDGKPAKKQQAKAEKEALKAAKEKARAEKAAAKAEKKMAAPAPMAVEEDAAPVAAKKFSAAHSLLSILFLALCAGMLAWVLFNVHPASGSVSSVESSTVLKLSEKLDVYMNNMASDALGVLAYIKKIYTLQESDTVAPIPNPENFGRTTDVAVIQDLIKKAAPLLDGQSVAFDPNADFVPDTEFMYYLDDTIMVIAWKEYINQRCCTMAEVKLAHGSQIRRKLAEDSYSSSVQYYASDMAKQSNAVIAINGDFYAFRDLGITVYQRKLYRNNPASVDSCFFTADGDMLFSRRGELMGEGEAQRFIDENNVVFAIAFGPVLVDNGELQYCESYPIGEINTEYSRSCIGMTDDLHYLLMTINHTPDARPRATINELARYIYSKGVQKAYTLDGGQTAEIVMFGAPINHVDFGYERTVSDIIYFATAIPNEEVSQ